jgi:hypothetical protein
VISRLKIFGFLTLLAFVSQSNLALAIEEECSEKAWVPSLENELLALQARSCDDKLATREANSIVSTHKNKICEKNPAVKLVLEHASGAVFGSQFKPAGRPECPEMLATALADIQRLEVNEGFQNNLRSKSFESTLPPCDLSQVADLKAELENWRATGCNNAAHEANIFSYSAFLLKDECLNNKLAQALYSEATGFIQISHVRTSPKSPACGEAVKKALELAAGLEKDGETAKAATKLAPEREKSPPRKSEPARR